MVMFFGLFDCVLCVVFCVLCVVFCVLCVVFVARGGWCWESAGGLIQI
jgi:hypothetical protein